MLRSHINGYELLKSMESKKVHKSKKIPSFCLSEIYIFLRFTKLTTRKKKINEAKSAASFCHQWPVLLKFYNRNLQS